MNICFPKNLFSELIFNSLPDELRRVIRFLPSSAIAAELLSSGKSAALLPVMDLLKHKDLFISGSFGISFEGALNPAYIYFNSSEGREEFTGRKEFKEISAAGDVSSTEIILAKILFDELYDSSVSVNLLKPGSSLSGKNVIIAGDQNFSSELLFSGISFSEEVIEMLSLPFAYYVLASENETLLKNLNENFKGLSSKIYDNAEEELKFDFSSSVKEYIRQNISSLVLDLDSNDRDGIGQLLQLPYLHGMIENIIDIKFVYD